MPTIFAIDGAEEFGEFGYLGELGAYSSSVASLQTALITLGQKVGDATLSALVLDGLIGPKTTAAANRAFAMYVSGAPANYATGTLSQSQVSTNAASLAQYVTAEIARRGGTASSTTAPVRVPAAATPVATSPYTPSLAPAISDNTTKIVKWSAIGLGGVVVASILYYVWRWRQGRPAFGDFGGRGDRINDNDREQWVNNDEGLYRWYQSERRQGGGIRGFIKRHRGEIDAAIRSVQDAPPRSSFGADGPSQRDMFYRAGRQRAEADQTFLHMVKTGLTRGELEKLIAKRPEVWGKYRDWIRLLPYRHGVGPDRFKRDLGAGLGASEKRKYNAIAQVTGKTRDGWSTSWGLRSVTGIEASSESEARRAAMAVWRKRGEWPARGKRYNLKSLRLHVTVAEGY